MHLNPNSSSRTPMRSRIFLFLILGNLLFSSIFVASMGVQVVKTSNNLPQEVEAKATTKDEQKLITLAQIN
jgi:hypothetical protein